MNEKETGATFLAGCFIVFVIYAALVKLVDLSVDWIWPENNLGYWQVFIICIALSFLGGLIFKNNSNK